MRRDLRAIIPVGDAGIAVATAVIACLVGMQYSPRSLGPDPIAYGLTALIFLPFAVRRRAPVLGLAVSGSALLMFLALGYDQIAWNFWGPVLLLYTVASLRPPKVTALCTAAVVPVLVWTASLSDVAWYLAVAEGLVVPLTAWAMGNVGRQLDLRNRELAVLTRRLRLGQQLRTERAVTEERVRIARELHDVVAHHMSVIAVQTGLASYLFDDDPPVARVAVDTIAATSREALREMRRLLVLLRSDDQPGDTALSLAHLPALAGRMRSVGLPVTLDLRPEVAHLPPGLQLCAYRVVQEALTNIIKHAGLVATNVVVRVENDRLTARITNEPGTPARKATDPGHGLNNMRERAALYHGLLFADHRADGGFVVELTLPVTPADGHDDQNPAMWSDVSGLR